VKKRTTYHHGDLRNALIQAALELIAAHGVEGFTLRDCAKKAGVSVAAPYRHFETKDDLLAAVAADCIQRLGDAMDRAVEAAGDVDPLSVFRATGIAYVRFAVEHPAHFRVMYLPQVMARMPKDVESAFTAWGEEMTAKLLAAQKDGVLADFPLQQIMLACSCITHGLAHMIVDDVDGLGGLDPDAAAKLAVDITGVLGYGLLPRAESATAVLPPAPKAPRAPRTKKGRGAGALVLAAIALGGAHADAKPKLVAADANYDRDKNFVSIASLAVDPAGGTFVLVSDEGPVGVLAVDRSSPDKGGCPYEVELHLVDPPAKPSAGRVAVVGPIDLASTARPRLLALNALGVAPPKGVSPLVAIDLDGDGVVDLLSSYTESPGHYVAGAAKGTASIDMWTRAGKRWTRSVQCKYSTTFTIE
jgi:AcrR family transcriptional regulator